MYIIIIKVKSIINLLQILSTFDLINNILKRYNMVDQGDSTPSPIRWDLQQKMYIQVNSIQHAAQLDEINNQINEHINEQDEYDNYLINEINDYDIVTSIPLIWDQEKKNILKSKI